MSLHERKSSVGSKSVRVYANKQYCICSCVQGLRLCLHGANIVPFIAQILVSYEITLTEFAQSTVNLFVHVNKALELTS